MNKMSKAESYMKLKEELESYRKLMTQAADVVVEQNVSDYPIFVAHQQQVEIGMSIFDASKQGGKWNIHASTLEEFVSKQIILTEKIEDFKKNYRDPSLFVCVFVLSELGAEFVFLPRKS